MPEVWILELNVMYNLSIILIFSFAVIVFILLFFVTAPYGKFHRKGWGPSIRSKWAWMIMESPSPVLLAYFFLTSDQKNLPQIIFILFWFSHYIHRTFIYPFTQSGRDKSYPLFLVCMAFIFNCFNGFVNGYGVFYLYFANLFPRGVSSHKWYKKQFPGYPPERKAVIPFIV